MSTCPAETLFYSIQPLMQKLSNDGRLNQQDDCALRASLKQYWAIEECPHDCVPGKCLFANLADDWLAYRGYTSLAEFLEVFEYKHPKDLAIKDKPSKDMMDAGRPRPGHYNP